MKAHRPTQFPALALALVACGGAEPEVPPPPEPPAQPIPEPEPPKPEPEPEPPTSPTVDPTGLVAYYPLDGDGRDAGGRGHDGLLLGTTPTSDRHGEGGQALAFDGVDDGVVVADSADFDLTNGDFTIAFWLRQFSEDLAAVVAHTPTREGSGWLVAASDVSPEMWVPDARATAESASAQHGSWIHVSFVKQGTALFAVIDGTEYAAGEVVMSAAPALAELRIGFYGADGVMGQLEGELDELVIFERALDASELGALRDGGSRSLAGTQSPVSVGAAPEPVWTWCPLVTGNPTTPDAECTVAHMQLDPNDGTAGRHPYFVKRLPAADEPEAQLWLLSGGPGFSGETLEALAMLMHMRAPNTEIYLPDHRGIGRSYALGCNPQQAPSSEGGVLVTPDERDGCLDALDRLHGRRMPHLNMSAHARDLGTMIEVVGRPNVPVFVYGLSYGGRLAFRHQELFPGQVDGVILDSPFLPGHDITEQEAWVDEAGETLMRMCAEDAGCSDKIPDDPWALTQSVRARLDEGHCSELGIDGLTFGRLLGRMLLSGTAVRALVPAVAYRADRCAAGDIEALTHLLELAFPEQPNPPPPQFTEMLNLHVVVSELWPDAALSPSEYEAAEQGLTMSSGNNVGLAEVHARWSRYTPEHENTWPSLDVPFLVLQSEIDPNTAPSLMPELESHFTRNDQQIVMFPHANHVVVHHSRTADRDSCGADLMADFIADPTAPLDTTCADAHVRHDFEIEPALNFQLFGTRDRWENE